MHVFIHFKTIRGFCPQICEDSFSLQPQVFSVPCKTCFSKGTILHFTQRLRDSLSLHEVCDHHLIVMETGYQGLNNPHKIKKNIFLHLWGYLLSSLVIYWTASVQRCSAVQRCILTRMKFCIYCRLKMTKMVLVWGEGFFLVSFILNKWHMNFSTTVWIKLFDIDLNQSRMFDGSRKISEVTQKEMIMK